MLPLADEFFFVALDDHTGRHRLSPRVLALGVAAALLGELVLQDRLAISGDRVEVVRQPVPPADALAHQVLDHLLAEPERHPVRTWLVFLAQRAPEQVAERLWRAGLVRRERARRLFKVETLYPPTDVNVAYGPTARLSNHLRQGRQMSWQEATLAGLAVATGLENHLLYTTDTGARDYLRHILEHLYPSLHSLVWHLRSAVGDAVLTGRT